MERSLRSLVIDTREIYKSAVESIKDYVTPYYQKAVELHEIEDYTADVSVWNDGFMLNIVPVYDKNKIVDNSKLAYKEFVMFSQPDITVDDNLQIKYANETGVNIDWNHLIYYEVRQEKSPDIEKIKTIIDKKYGKFHN